MGERGCAGKCVERRAPDAGPVKVYELHERTWASGDRHRGGFDARLAGVADFSEPALARVAILVVLHPRISWPVAGRVSAARDRRNDAHLGAAREFRFEPLEKAHVLVADVDVHEAADSLVV